MRRLLCLASFCFLLASLVVTPICAAEEVAWHSDLEEAFEVARETNRPLLLHFWTPDCIPCRRLERNVLNQPRVVETLTNQFVPVKINAQEFPQLAARYHVSSVPKDVILNTRDEELLRLFTPQDPDQYVAQLSAVVLRNGGATTATKSRVSESPASPEAASTRVASKQSPRPVFASQEMSRGQSAETPENDSAATQEARCPEDDFEKGPREVMNRFAARIRGKVGSRDTPSDTTMEQGRKTEVAETAAAKVAAEPTSGSAPDDASAPAVAADASSDRPSRSPKTSSVNRATALADAGQETAQAAVADATTIAATTNKQPSAPEPADSLGLEGYCPVTLIRGNAWKKGVARYGATHRGKTYLFTGSAEKDTFLADPDAFSPILAGTDPVELARTGNLREGRRAHGLVYHDRVYMFASEENLEAFLQQPESFTKQIDQAMETGDLSVFRR
jgi:YHS domain-containing protein/thiol-disulfide isomerase/thioredoxin